MSNLKRRHRKCEECPYRDLKAISEAELANARCIGNQDFPCHMDDGFHGGGETSCRGHWEASRMAVKRGIESKPLPETEWI